LGFGLVFVFLGFLGFGLDLVFGFLGLGFGLGLDLVFVFFWGLDLDPNSKNPKKQILNPKPNPSFFSVKRLEVQLHFYINIIQITAAVGAKLNF